MKYAVIKLVSIIYIKRLDLIHVTTESLYPLTNANYGMSLITWFYQSWIISHCSLWPTVHLGAIQDICALGKLTAQSLR